MWQKLANIDRRILWAIQLVIMVVILLRPIGLPIQVGAETQRYYDFLDNLPEGSIIWLEYGFAPSGEVEIGPMVTATFHHAFSRGLRVVGGGLWPVGPHIAESLFNEIADQYPDVEYGVNYVNLGFNPGQEMLARQLVDDVWRTVRNVDHYGNPLSELPLMEEVPRLTADYVSALIVFSEGSPGPEEWLAAVTEHTGIPQLIGAIQMSVPRMMPYIATGQYAAIIPGARGTAEYEFLLGQPGSAIAGQDVMSAMTVYLWLLILVGNVAFTMTTRRKRS